MRRQATAVLALAAIALFAVWHTLPRSAPPLYDGTCSSDPYRALGSSPAPTSASKHYAGAAFPTSEVITSESPPQAQLLMTDGTFVSATPFTITIVPVAAPSTAPSDGHVDGNVYRMAARTDSGVALTPKQPITIDLRGTSSASPRVIERFDGTSWTRLQTFAPGCGDAFEAVSNDLGEFAVVAGAASAAGAPVGLITGIVVVIAVVAALALVRARRLRDT